MDIGNPVKRHTIIPKEAPVVAPEGPMPTLPPSRKAEPVEPRRKQPAKNG